MAKSMKGLKVKPAYEYLIGVAKPDNLQHIRIPSRGAKFLREGFILSQLGGEGMRQMQLQQAQAIKRTFKEHLLKQASDTTGVYIFGSRHSSNAVAQTYRINNMLRPTSFRDVFVQQGSEPSRPSQFTDELFETFHQEPQVLDISDGMDTTTAPTGPYIDEQAARAKSLAGYELRQQGI